eukprot:3876474-Pyramimonas_sp.AAC.1
MEMITGDVPFRCSATGAQSHMSRSPFSARLRVLEKISGLARCLNEVIFARPLAMTAVPPLVPDMLLSLFRDA